MQDLSGWFNKAGLSQALGTAGLGLGSVMMGGNYNNPADAAQPYFDQIPGTISPYYQPYINAGQGAMSSLQDQYGQLVNDPAAKLNSIGQGYQQSPGYQFKVDQATKAANQAAAAGGMLGSPMEQQQLASTVTGLADQDYYNWMNQALGLYGSGLSGYQGLNQMGYGASNELAQSLANALMSQGQLAYTGAANQNAMNQQQDTGWGALFSGISSAVPLFL